MTAIKERPILFSAPMVRAILDGRKTVTRRPVKGWQVPTEDTTVAAGERHRWMAIAQRDPRYGFGVFGPTEAECAKELEEFAPCPYGRRGERLWVREAWQDVHPVQVIDRYSQPGRAGIPGPPGVTYQTIYRADGDYPPVHYTHEHPYRCLEPDPNHGFRGAANSGWTGWTPSIHMPRWACRIVLEITDVRVERLQDISRADIRAEGLQCPPELASDDVSPNYRDWYPAAWKELWNSTGGDWDANPWVWVVEFKRVTP
ncbi:hypothetical protein [Pseudomonas sp. FR229a]|uniref:hypothetical protein n=1 Tax=Pseudomonas sp. FR229a TaxID=3040313 RepID=UPI002555FDE7|nr:hypothetical protein [Pseudomonas sp. FR229a]